MRPSGWRKGSITPSEAINAPHQVRTLMHSIAQFALVLSGYPWLQNTRFCLEQSIFIL